MTGLVPKDESKNWMTSCSLLSPEASLFAEIDIVMFATFATIDQSSASITIHRTFDALFVLSGPGWRFILTAERMVCLM